MRMMIMSTTLSRKKKNVRDLLNKNKFLKTRSNKPNKTSMTAWTTTSKWNPQPKLLSRRPKRKLKRKLRRR
jgi:hypothetical protein